jgi:hypothetical protein
MPEHHEHYELAAGGHCGASGSGQWVLNVSTNITVAIFTVNIIWSRSYLAISSLKPSQSFVVLGPF